MPSSSLPLAWGGMLITPPVPTPDEVAISRLHLCQCKAPITSEYQYCLACRKNNDSATAQELRISRTILPLTYWVNHSPVIRKKEYDQFRKYMHEYKNPKLRADSMQVDESPSEDESAEVPSAEVAVQLLLYAALRRHWQCLEKMVYSVDHLLVVPSSKGRISPLNAWTTTLRPDLVREVQVTSTRAPDEKKKRKLRPEQFDISEPLHGHVLIVDDTWVTGSTAQSLAARAYEKGARSVTIIPLARALDCEWEPSAIFLRTYTQTADIYSVEHCFVDNRRCYYHPDNQ